MAIAEFEEKEYEIPLYIELSRRGQPAQHLARPMVQPILDARHTLGRQPGEALALGQKAPNQPIGVLVRAALPRVVGSGKESLGAGRGRHISVPCELQTVVVGREDKMMASGLFSPATGNVRQRPESRHEHQKQRVLH